MGLGGEGIKVKKKCEDAVEIGLRKRRGDEGQRLDLFPYQMEDHHKHYIAPGEEQSKAERGLVVWV